MTKDPYEEWRIMCQRAADSVTPVEWERAGEYAIEAAENLLAYARQQHGVEIVPGHQSARFASERQEKRGLK